MRTDLVDLIIETVLHMEEANRLGDVNAHSHARAELMRLARALRKYDEAQERADQQRIEALRKAQSTENKR